MMTTRGQVLLAVLAIACGSPGDHRRAGGDVALRSGPSARQADPLVSRADSLVRAGRAWRATLLLASRTKDPAQASADLLIVAARAAAAWEGWTEVDRLLANASWLDSQFEGEGRELKARSALERNVDAVPDALLALADAKGSERAAIREVLLARSYDRASSRDSAAMHYAAGATRLARVSDWLRLREAGVTGDSAQRAAMFARIASAPARARIMATDAQARERSGDLAGAALAFRKAGQEGAAFRVEALAARDSASRSSIAARIVSYFQTSPPNAEVRQSLDVLERLGALTPAENLIVARAAASAAQYPRAVTGFASAATGASLGAADRMSYANALARSGKSADAQRIYATITDDARLAPLAAYQRARLVALGNSAQGKQVLRSVATQYSATRASAAPALLLLADLQVDDNDMAGATASLRELVSRHADAAQAPLARFRLGLLQWPAPAAAAATFDTLVQKYPRDEEALPAQYWAARARDRSGQKARADDAYRAIMKSAPQSYYAVLSAKQLKAPGWTPPAGADSGARIASLDSAVERVRLLRLLGMDVEAGFERDAIASVASSTPAQGASVVRALTEINEPARALRVALAALESGTATRALVLAAYPVLHDDALLEEAKRNDLDPALVAGLIRQESNWNPHALSAANARGLMQLLPSVGASVAAGRKYPLWNTALLYEPDVNLELGMAHLASSLKRNTPVEQALAAYNAGASRVTRWMQRPGSDDAELFTEMIPFTETRDYVRLVLRNAAVYRALYRM